MLRKTVTILLTLALLLGALPGLSLAAEPNIVYHTLSLSTSDALAAQQWALSNDGTFAMEEEKNRFPVFENPFDAIPSAPGQWRMPGDFGRPGGRFARGFAARSGRQAATTATAGIDVGVETAWAAYNGGERDVVVALIDTGVDASHEDLQNVLWTNPGEVAGNGVDDDGNGYIDDVHGWNFYDGNNKVSDGDSHGTHGAGTILANSDNGVGVSGILKGDRVKLMSLKALGGKDGSGTTESIIKAIEYAEANGASICNLSLGSSLNDPALYRAIASSKMLFVVAAGNDGADNDKTPCYPASYDLDNILSVANLNYDGALHSSSNYGAVSVDLAAPGSYILSTTPGNSYSYMTGTSMAAPMVTAAAAMLYSADSSLSLADVKDVLLASARKLDSLTGSVLTGGMLDLGAAMTYDKSNLTHRTWTAQSTGSAPTITVEQTESRGRTVLTVTVTDPDGDATDLRYASGSLTAEQFRQGVGSAVSLDTSGKVSFYTDGGTFTFYAADRHGNETVKTVTLSSASRQAGGSRGW